MKTLCGVLFMILYSALVFADGPVMFYHGARHMNEVTLTFDDGPHPDYTPELLRILREANVKATFFVVGKAVANYPKLTRKIAEEGHEIANHSYMHYRYDGMSTADMAAELRAVNELIERTTGQKPVFFRPPGGRYNKLVLDAVGNEGMVMGLWDVNAGDYYKPIPVKERKPYRFSKRSAQRRSQSMVRDVVGRTRGGSVILFHNTDGETLKAIPEVIRLLREKGYDFVPMASLLTRSKVSKNR
ncbi:MAG: polysaccharide deacetylase family protein [bacterium]|nr:polysaccharide deacetylase family protein [bacterium]